jgi:tetratricopeptide (TPR) repeat protein
MDTIGTHDSADTGDDEDKGTILNDEQFLQAIKNRDDIFVVEKGTRLKVIETFALGIAAILGAWLSTVPMMKIAPPVDRNAFNKRMATLYRGSVPSAIVLEEPQEGSGKKAGSGRKPVVIEFGMPHPVAGVRTDREKRAVRQDRDVVPATTDKAGAPGAGQGEESVVENESDLINQGNANKLNGNRAEAFEAFKRVLKQNPRNTEALSGLGDLFLYTGILDSAALFYTNALAVNPRIPAAHNGLGTVRYYLSMHAVNPNYARFMNIKDPAKFIAVQYDSAVAEYTAAISLDSANVEALTNRGVIREAHNDRNGAVKDYSLAIKINPGYAEAFCKRASAYKTMGKYRDAVADYAAAIDLDSGSYKYDPRLHFANAYFGRGGAYLRMGEIDKAIADFDSALVLSPRHSLAIINRAIALGRKKHYDSAIAGYTLAISLLSPLEYNGALFLAYVHRGNAYKALGRYDEAVADYKISLKSSALAARSCWRIAECLALKRDKTGALHWLNQAIDNGFKEFSRWERDPDLEVLHHDKEFQSIVNGKAR